MGNLTFNAAIDYFGLESASNNALKVKSSNENRSQETASGANSYGDAAVVDMYGATAAPSADYDVIGEIDHDPEVQAKTLVTLGTVSTVQGMAKPVVLGTLSVSTQTGSAPSVSAQGQMVQTGATQLREYPLPKMHITTRHRAQDFLGLCAVKKGSADASDVDDYGYSSINASFPIQITLAQPQGDLKNYDLHGDMATVDFTMNWYASTAPTIELTPSAVSLGAALQGLASRSDPENGYTQYTWQVAFPLVGEEVSA